MNERTNKRTNEQTERTDREEIAKVGHDIERKKGKNTRGDRQRGHDIDRKTRAEKVKRTDIFVLL